MATGSKKAKSEGNLIHFPGPKKVVSSFLESIQAPTFKGFHAAAVAGDPAAAKVISELLGISEEAGAACAKFYARRFAEDNGHVLRTILLRSEIKSGALNTVLALLRESFGLEGPDALTAYNKLKAESLLAD
jgi:hypothetical protein